MCIEKLIRRKCLLKGQYPENIGKSPCSNLRTIHLLKGITAATFELQYQPLKGRVSLQLSANYPPLKGRVYLRTMASLRRKSL